VHAIPARAREWKGAAHDQDTAVVKTNRSLARAALVILRPGFSVAGAIGRGLDIGLGSATASPAVWGSKVG